MAFTLALSAVIFLAADMLEQENYPVFEGWYATDFMFIIIPGAVVVLSIRLSLMHGITGSHGKAWIFFSAFVVLWFVAEQLYDYDLDYDLNNFESYVSDVLWLAGYALFFVFAVHYMQIVKSAISKKIILVSCLASAIVLAPSLYLTLEESDLNTLEGILSLSYAILDAVVLTPTVIGIIMFFKGEVNFLWILVLIAILCNVVGDVSYTIAQSDDTYYPGQPLDILFLWAYVFLSFGVYSHIKLFNIKQNNLQTFDQK